MAPEHPSPAPKPWNSTSDGLHPKCRKRGHDWKVIEETRTGYAISTNPLASITRTVSYKYACVRCGVTFDG